jgi:hypothetical protein
VPSATGLSDGVGEEGACDEAGGADVTLDGDGEDVAGALVDAAADGLGSAEEEAREDGAAVADGVRVGSAVRDGVGDGVAEGSGVMVWAGIITAGELATSSGCTNR